MIALWFGDDNWTMKFFEYRLRWWDKTVGKEELTTDYIGQKFLLGQMKPKVDQMIT